jgi:hypothetical protein
MSYTQKRYDFNDLTIYHAKAEPDFRFPSLGVANIECIGVFYFSGELSLVGSDGRNISACKVGAFSPWKSCKDDIICTAGPDGADWLCFSYSHPETKSVEQVEVDGSYQLLANTQAILVVGDLTVDGVDHSSVSELLFEEDKTVSGTGTLLLIRKIV